MTLSWYSVGGHLNTNKESTEHSPISLVTISVLQLIPLDPQLTIKWGPLEHLWTCVNLIKSEVNLKAI